MGINILKMSFRFLIAFGSLGLQLDYLFAFFDGGLVEATLKISRIEVNHTIAVNFNKQKFKMQT